ncbi:hypothetical protein Tco_1001478 [Tanacetum coccineum]
MVNVMLLSPGLSHVMWGKAILLATCLLDKSLYRPNEEEVGPFKVLAKVRPIAYKLELPQKLIKVHSTFHVSNLKKCLSDESLVIPLDEIQVDDKLHFVEELEEVMDREVKRLKQSRIPIVKVRWKSRRCLEFTWERED